MAAYNYEDILQVRYKSMFSVQKAEDRTSAPFRYWTGCYQNLTMDESFVFCSRLLIGMD